MLQFRDDVSLFENCLARLEAGEDLESILASFPNDAGKLRPLLEAAIKARQSGEPVRIPASAKIDSRTRFLAEANRMQTRQPVFQPRFRLAGAIAIAIFVLFAGLFGTGLASAETVPGETLYPVKRVVEKAQLALTTNQSSKLNLEEEFDRRRVTETEELAEAGSSESVTIAGTLNETTDHVWMVGNVPLNLTVEQVETAHTLRGSYVEVKGNLQAGIGLSVDTMELRLFTISGVLDSINDQEWLVSGVKILVMEDTQITGKPEIGKKVSLTALHYNDEYFLALSARFTGPSMDEPEQRNDGKGNHETQIDKDKEETHSPSETPEPTETRETKSTEYQTTAEHSVTVTVNPSGTPDPKEVDD